MKKGIFFFLIPFFCIPFYHLTNANPGGVPLFAYSFKTSDVTLFKPILGEIVFLPDTSFVEEDALIMINNLQKIDHNILKEVAEQQIQIKLFKGSLTDQNGLSSLKEKKPVGYSVSDPNWDQVPGMSEDRVVYAKIGHSEYGKGHGSVSLELHEVAHAIDRYVFHNVRKNQTFINIWKQEVKQLFPHRDYFIKFPEEYFAEAFAMYYYNNNTRYMLQERAPLTYVFFQSLEKQAAIRQKTYVNEQ